MELWPEVAYIQVELRTSSFKPGQYILQKRQFGKKNPLSANPTKWSNTLKQFVRDIEMEHCLKIC